jgi:hemerythrin-like domain-containing protein
MNTSPFPSAAPDFSDPLGLLRACHGRILGHCDTLERLLPHLAAHGADAEACEAMARVHRYFSTAAQHHHADEEQDLFPQLMTVALELHALIAELATEHTTLSAHWAALAPLLAAPEQATADPARFAGVVAGFVSAYRAHAEKENLHLLPRAGQVLSTDFLKELGARMATRRGVKLA